MKILFKAFNLILPFLCNKYSKSENPRHLRIADILLQEEEEEEEDGLAADLFMEGCGERREKGCMVIECSTARRIVARWLSGLRKARERKIVVRSERIREQESKREIDVTEIRSSTNGLNGGDLVVSVQGGNESGRERKDTSFNLGAGCCLLYLIAASRNELDKMVELRTQMEVLLENTKEELQRKDLLSKPSAPTDLLAYSTTDAPEGPESDNHLSPQILSTSSNLPESSTIMVFDQSSKCDTPKGEEHLEGMDQLEAELEAELEHLQLHLDTEKCLKHPQHQRIKVTVKDSASQGLSYGELIDPQEACSEMHCGVPPYELERRLHELLEVRQQEQIRELEAALECAKHKLREKEIEISWWKDTAQLISQRVPEPFRLTSKSGKETYCLSR